MFDKLEDLIHHYEELMNLLSEPDVANDANRFKKLMKERNRRNPCRCRRRGSSTFCSGNLPYVCALRREQRLEGGDT